MLEENFSIKPIIEIFFKILKKSSNYFADAYLLKDVSLISKWKTGRVVPKNEDISKLVEFVNNESTEMQRHLIRLKVEEYINESLLDISLKNMLIGFDDFSTFLTETLIMSVSDTNTDLNENNISSPSENSIKNEEIVHNEEIAREKDITNNSNGFKILSKSLSQLFHKKITKIILIILVLCMAIFSFQQFINYKTWDYVFYQNSLANTPNRITLSNKYFISYTHMKDSQDVVQVDINGNPLKFNNLHAQLVDGVLYLPLGETIRGLGFSFISYNGITQTYKEISSGKTVITKVDSEKMMVDDKKIKLSDPVIMKEFEIYIPAYFLMGFTTYLDKIIPQNVEIKVDNIIEQEYEFKPRIVNDVLYLPFRQVFEMFDYKVNPDRRTQGGAQRAIAKKDSSVVEVEESSEYVIVNKKRILLDGLVFMSNNTTYVSADIIKKALNKDYNWDKDNNILEIKTGE